MILPHSTALLQNTSGEARKLLPVLPTWCSACAPADWGTGASRQWDARGNPIFMVLLGFLHCL